MHMWEINIRSMRVRCMSCLFKLKLVTPEIHEYFIVK